MAAGKIVSLVIPVLASIFKGLYLITTAHYPSNSSCFFPIHYLLGWMGAYLRTYTSMKRHPPGPYTVFIDDQLDFEEDMTFFLSLCTKMVGYREDSYFLLEAYNPHLFSKKLGFASAIPGFKSKSRDTVLDFEGLRYWRSCIITKLGQSMTFPSKGKSVPRLPSPVVPSSLKPLKKHSLPEGDLMDKDPKHSKWGSTRRPGFVIVSSPDVTATVTNDVKAPTLSEIAPSLGDEVHTEVVDYGEFLNCMITEVADVKASRDEAQTEHIESILRDSLKVAWAELCLFVEDMSYKALLAEEHDIMASFETLTRDAQCGVVPPEVHARLISIRKSSSKLQHEI
ncbi:hypothetical protein LIER_30388 [Lithospermum erythrorhizon]|uniref:Aminotransferase-like plant mobile domain-containing protein n=1 Tax=Lithospermum erythrorhizon TaxID=34254 RepID=A0AAV3RPC2_LITER